MTQKPSSSEENMAPLRRLALHLLAPSFDPQARQPQLLAGSLPVSLPFDLPLPDGYEVIGSFVRNPEDIQIVIDTDQSTAAVIAFYTERMQAAGWSEPDFQRRRRGHESGFVDTFYSPRLSTIFCKGPHGPSLLISAFAGQDTGGRTEVRLHIDTRSRNSPCRQSSEIFMEVGALIPALEPPPGGRQLAGGGGGSNSEGASTSATLELERDIDLLSLAKHYAQQLEQAGWQRTGEGSAEPLAWHSWEFRDKQNERWSGVFTLLQIPAMERRYYLQILINWVENTSR